MLGMRRHQITLIFILTSALFWVGLTSWRTHIKTLAIEKIQAQPVAQAEAPAQHLSQVQPASISSAASDKIDPKELEFKMPDRETYVVQVTEQEKQEGAGLPPVLRKFSVRMAELMEKASQSPRFAAALFDRLKECAGAKHGETIHQARTICAVNAIRLGEIHPQTLGNQAKAFRESLPARLKTRVVTLGF